MIGIKLEKKKKISITENIKEINAPKIVYIPLMNGNAQNVTVFVKRNEYVCKGQMIGKIKGDFGIPLFSSVSGTVIDFIEKTGPNGLPVKCVAIENDGKEREEKNVSSRTLITTYTKDEFVACLHDCGIVGMGGSSFPTYVKYKTDTDLKTLIVNAVECEPYSTADYMLLKTKVEEILECCDAIMEINHMEECYIAIKIHNDELKEIIKTFIGTYPKVQIIEVPDIYPMGWEKSLVRYIKHVDYKNIPLEKGIVVNNISTVYAIYEALKYHKPLIERVVTFSGEVCEHPQNIKVKIGTSAKEIIHEVIKTTEKQYTIVSGGPMMGNVSRGDDIIIGPNVNCILLFEDTLQERSISCIRCGKCVRVCPAKIAPVLIKDSIHNEKRLQSLHVNKCIECGLCSYICPSKIAVREYVRKAKEKIGKRG